MIWPDLINALSWWQWLVLLAVPPAIIALYFLKLKRQPVEVPSTYLWHKSIEDLHVNTIWQRLRNNLLLWLQLIVVGLVMLAVLQPGWRSQKLPGNRFVFLLDNSASMQAADVAPNRLEEAKRQTLETIDQMQSGDVGMVIAFNETADVKQSFTDNRRQLRRAVEAIRPTVRTTSLLEALKVASGLANPARTGTDPNDVQVAEALPATLFIYSDGKFDDVSGFSLGNLEPVYRPIGDPGARNVGIVAMSVRRHETKPDQLQAFARLGNFGLEEANVSVELDLDGKPMDASRFAVQPGETHGVAFNLGALESGVLHLKAAAGDHLALDDEAWIAVNKPRRAKVLLVGPGNEPLQLALSTSAALEISEVTVEDPKFLEGEKYRQQMAAGTYDLVIFDRCAPKEMPQANTFFIGRLPPGDLWKAGEKTGRPQIIDVDGAHPLMQWVDMVGNVLVADATPLVPPPGGRVLVDSNRGGLLAIAPREGFEDVVLGFVLIDDVPGKGKYIGTDWYIRVSFTNFVKNLLDYVGGARAVAAGDAFQPGQQVALENPVPGKPLSVLTPSGEASVLTEGKPGKFLFSNTGELGAYPVRVGGETVQHFAVNLFHAAESDIRPRAEVKIGRVPVQGESAPQAARREIWRLLLFCGLAVLLLEWYIFNRRVAM